LLSTRQKLTNQKENDTLFFLHEFLSGQVMVRHWSHSLKALLTFHLHGQITVNSNIQIPNAKPIQVAPSIMLLTKSALIPFLLQKNHQKNIDGSIPLNYQIKFSYTHQERLLFAYRYMASENYTHN